MLVGASIRETLDIESGMTRSQREDKVAGLMDRVGLHKELAYRYPHELSGGQKQRANIARALTCMPKVIVCDEAVANNDFRHRSEEQTSELQSLMRTSYAVFCLKQKKK